MPWHGVRISFLHRTFLLTRITWSLYIPLYVLNLISLIFTFQLIPHYDSSLLPLQHVFPIFHLFCSILKPTHEIYRLSYAELYLTLGLLFRTVDMELFETTHADVDIAYDWLAPHPRKDTKGVRVLIK